MILTTLIVFIIILGLLIFVHELGHFVMAKRAGMRVEEFGFGFPPKIFGIKKGETIYSLNWIPLGGFVKITGENGDNAADPRAFVNKAFWPRLAVLSAGVTMNLLTAWFLLFIGFWLVGAPVEISGGIDESGVKDISNPAITVIAVSEDSPAKEIGMRPGDTIVSIDGRAFGTIEEMIEYTVASAGTAITYELRRGPETFQRELVPRENPPEGSGPVGFIPGMIAETKYSFFTSLQNASISFFNRLVGIILAFAFLFKQLFTGGGVSESLSGPVGIAVLTRDFTRLGLPYLIQFTAVLSINLALINAFPFPALDGGRILFLFIEKIRGVRSKIWEHRVNLIGFMLLLLLMVVITFRDVAKFSGQFQRLFENIF